MDVGCGAQPYRCLFSSDAEYIGIDNADAKSHFGYAIPDTRYFEGTTWPVADASVNFLLCTETLEHVLDFEGFLHEAARCLVPGGRILLTVPFSARLHYIPYDYWRFTPSSLDLILLLLMPQGRSLPAGMALRLVGLLFLPLFLVLGIIGNLSLLGRGGDDCLGYTALTTGTGSVGPVA